MLSVWHKADIYRIPIYAPVTAKAAKESEDEKGEPKSV